MKCLHIRILRAIRLFVVVVTSVVSAISVAADVASETERPLVSSSVSTERVQVAEPFRLSTKVEVPLGARVTFPPVGDKLGAFDVTGQKVIEDFPSAEDTDKRIWSRTLTLESITVGDLEIPPHEVQVQIAGETVTLQTKPIPMHVISVLEDRADPTQFRDIHSLNDLEAPIKSSSNSWMWWSGGAAVVGLSGAAMLFSVRRRNMVTPVTWAHQQLSALQASRLVEQGDDVLVPSELSLIIRDYLQHQFELEATAHTSTELLSAIRQQRLLPDELVDRYLKLLADTDLVKFAGLSMSSADLNSVIDQTRELIDATAEQVMSFPQTEDAA